MNINARTGALGAAMLGVCLGLCQGSPWAWLPAQFTLVLMLALLRTSQGQVLRVALQVWLFGMAYGIAGLIFMPLSLPASRGLLLVLPLVAMIAVYAGLAAAGAALIQRLPAAGPWRWLLAWPACWVLLEWLQAQGDYAVAWLTLGQLQAPYGPLAGLLPVGGVLMASQAMWLWAALLVSLITDWRTATKPLWRLALPTLALPTACLILAALPWTKALVPFDVVLVQAATDQPPGASADDARHAVRRWQEQLLFLPQRHPSTLILTPQASLNLRDDADSFAFVNALEAQLQAGDADLVLGAYVQDRTGALSNSALALGVSGRQRYDKIQLLPFGEFTPHWLQGRLRVGWPVPERDLLRGARRQSELLLGGHRVALSLCFELAFPDVWRQMAAGADVLINISSDAAHPSLRMAEQALQLARARALEFGKPMIRTSDWAGSFVLDSEGRLLAEIPAAQAGEVRVQVPARTGLTLYAKVGHITVLSLCGCAILLSLVPLLRCRRPGGSLSLGASVRSMRQQAGQVLMAALGLLLITAGLMYLMVNTGQMVTEKMRVTNAADAAAYSAGVVEARALNYDAYLNRAMVANEISIAQMVSLASWVKYFTTAVDNIPGTLGDITFFLQPDLKAAVISGTFAGAKYGLSYAGMSGEELAEWIINYGIGPIVTAHDVVIQAMSLSQEAVHLNLAAGARQWQIAKDVAADIDPRLSAQLVLQSHGFDAFTKSYGKSGSSGDQRGRFADVTTRSRDEFTRTRNWNIDSPFDIPLVRKNGALKKRGGTDLIGYDEWRGIDTLELHGQRFGCGKLGLSWCSDVQKPIGWGAVNVNAGAGDAGRGYHGNAYSENRRTASEADADMREPEYYHFSGLPDVRELRNLDPKADISTGITILMSKGHADTMTSGGSAIAKPGGQLAQFSDKPSGGKLMALSRAQIYFDRIAVRNDNKTEIGSLYNPYWRVRLVAPTAADKAYAAAQQGGMMVP